ncbi:hypothetical protein [Prosthecobacter sp.]|jgi:hypothetical protein|uniref:hypothetical protein n=1 Tax=Prosthecobacter sp. TaxID=1965333 RepID=UPI0037846FFC
MPVKSRLIFACAAALLLSNCGLIGTALRLAPYAMFFADENGTTATAGKSLEMRAREVQEKRVHDLQPLDGKTGSQVAFKR